MAGVLCVIAPGCGSSFEATASSDGGGGDASTEGDAATGDAGSSVDAGANDGSAHDASSVDVGTSDTGAPGSGEDAGADGGDGGACPTPHPMTCGTILECPCMDGTTQIGGCSNGFTCPEACCGHGGPT
jgi:hypothetical protein